MCDFIKLLKTYQNFDDLPRQRSDGRHVKDDHPDYGSPENPIPGSKQPTFQLKIAKIQGKCEETDKNSGENKWFCEKMSQVSEKNRLSWMCNG